MADYYEILGVGREASREEIRKAFRRLARETHPDANPGDTHAEERFREIAQAYEVLSDPTKRASYDRGGSFDVGDLFSSFAGVDDLLSRFFGGGFGFGGGPTGPAQHRAARGAETSSGPPDCRRSGGGGSRSRSAWGPPRRT